MRGHAQVSLLLVTIVCVFESAAAFGPEGHRLVGEIAEYHLCADARVQADLLLDGERLSYAGNWADWIRERAEWSHTSTWHYINVADDATVPSRSGADQSSGAPPGRGDVLWALNHFDRRFADLSLPREDRAQALRFLIHFLADVHQPLHVGRPGDRGGNAIAVRAAGRPTNLHRLWDAQYLLKSSRASGWKGKRAQFQGLLAMTAGQVGKLQTGGPVAWARESQSLRPRVYGFGTLPADDAESVLDAGYLSMAMQIVGLRLSQAGVRLAGRINAVYCDSPPDP